MGPLREARYCDRVVRREATQPLDMPALSEIDDVSQTSYFAKFGGHRRKRSPDSARTERFSHSTYTLTATIYLMTWENVAFSGFIGGVIGSVGAFGAAFYTLRSDRKAEANRHTVEIAEDLLANLVLIRSLLMVTPLPGGENIKEAVVSISPRWSKALAASLRLGGDLSVLVRDVDKLVDPGCLATIRREQWTTWQNKLSDRSSEAISEVMAFLDIATGIKPDPIPERPRREDT